MYFWAHCLSCANISHFCIWNLKSKRFGIIKRISVHQSIKLELLPAVFISRRSVCFEPRWQITANKWDIFLSTQGALIIDIYGMSTCMLAHTRMSARGTKEGFAMKSRQENKRGGGSYIFRSSSRDRGLYTAVQIQRGTAQHTCTACREP